MSCRNIIDAVFVVKDPSDEKTLRRVRTAVAAGFRLASPDLGARLAHLEYLRPYVIPAGYLPYLAAASGRTRHTYTVATYLVANESMTPRLLGPPPAICVDRKRSSMSEGRYAGAMGETSEFVQGV